MKFSLIPGAACIYGQKSAEEAERNYRLQFHDNSRLKFFCYHYTEC